MTFFDDAWLFCFFVVVCLLGVINMMMKNFSLLKTQWLLLRLIISLPLDPSARIAPQNKFAALVVDEDQDGERNGRKPPVEFEWVHAETLVHAGCVREESSQGRFEEDAKVEDVVAHSLVDDRVTARLANDQVGPLDDDDRHEESRVAGVLQLLTSIVGPFLSVRVLQIVDSSRVPVLAQSEELARSESVLGHDDEVNEESGGRLHHTDLTVSHGNQPKRSREY